MGSRYSPPAVAPANIQAAQGRQAHRAGLTVQRSARQPLRDRTAPTRRPGIVTAGAAVAALAPRPPTAKMAATAGSPRAAALAAGHATPASPRARVVTVGPDEWW